MIPSEEILDRLSADNQWTLTVLELLREILDEWLEGRGPYACESMMENVEWRITQLLEAADNGPR